jgi:menaquinone-dependent protoporphyrinogen oxidase
MGVRWRARAEECGGKNMLLITYATKYGSTRETAVEMAAALRDKGVSVDLKQMREVETLDEYEGVVMGAALYMGRLHGDARRFLARHKDALGHHPVALFVPGPVEKREKDFNGAREQLGKELARYPWFAPRASEVMGGSFDPMRLGFLLRLIPALRKMPASDARDWEAIRTWAINQTAVLQAAAG